MSHRRHFQILILLVGTGTAALGPWTVSGDAPEPAPTPGVQASASIPEPDGDAAPEPATVRALSTLRGELAAVLEPGAVEPAVLAQRLRDLAEQGRDLAEQAHRTGAPAWEMAARHLEAEARYQSIEQLLVDQQATTASFQLIQLRRVARALRTVNDPAAGAVGDYWALLADAITIRREVAEPELALPRLAQGMQIYLASHQTNVAAAPILSDLRPMLWRLYDQLGRSEAARALLPAIEASRWAADPAHADALAAMRRTAALVGEPLDLQIEADAGPWSLATHEGRAVLLHVVREAEPKPALPEAAQLDRVIVALTAPVEPMKETEATPAAPQDEATAPRDEVVRLRVTQREEAARLTSQLAIETVPRWVLVDERGVVFATGTLGAAEAVQRLTEVEAGEAEPRVVPYPESWLESPPHIPSWEVRDAVTPPATDESTNDEAAGVGQ